MPTAGKARGERPSVADGRSTASRSAASQPFSLLASFPPDRAGTNQASDSCGAVPDQGASRDSRPALSPVPRKEETLDADILGRW